MEPTAAILWAAANNGKYPPNVTAKTLAQVKRNKNWSALHEAAKNGRLPQGTTAKDLYSTNKNTDSPLHIAALAGHLPPGTTVQDLAHATKHSGWSALHEAASSGHLPPNTTAKDLAETKDNTGWTPLHDAAYINHLPPDTTIAILKTTQDDTGQSAWDTFYQGLCDKPNEILHYSPHLFLNNISIAIEAINISITEKPAIKTRATIWLGRVLALQTTPRPNNKPTNTATITAFH